MASALESLHDHDIASFVFMDLESTDLLCTRTRITELCLVAVNRLDLQGTGIFPRVTNKLTICLDPVKPVSASASVLTGLYNDTLECQKPFSCETVQLLTCFLQNLAKPVCLLAHNGNKFDFPLLMQELKRISMSLDATLLCADTLEAFRALDGWEPAGGKVPCICQFCIQCRNNRTPSREPVKPEPLAPMKRKLINGARSQDERVKIRRLEEQVNTSPVSRYQRELTINDTNNNARRTLVFGAERNAENSEENVDGRDFQLSKARCRRKLSFGDKQKETNAELEKGENGENCVLNKMLDGSENERKPGELDSQFSVGMEDDIYLEALENVEKQLGISETKDIEYESSKPDQEEKKTDFGVKNIETENDTNATRESNPAENCKTNTTETTRINAGCFVTNGSGYIVVTGRVEQSEIKLSTGPKTFGEANMMEVTEETVEQVGGSGENVTEHDNNVKQEPNSSSQAQSKTSQTDTDSDSEDQNDQKLFENQSKNNESTNSNKTPERQANSVAINVPSGSQTNHSPSSPSPQKPPSYKLQEIYLRTFGNRPQQTHKAEDDCVTLVKIAKKTKDFIVWVNLHAKPFSSFANH